MHVYVCVCRLKTINIYKYDIYNIYIYIWESWSAGTIWHLSHLGCLKNFVPCKIYSPIQENYPHLKMLYIQDPAKKSGPKYLLKSTPNMLHDHQHESPRFSSPAQYLKPVELISQRMIQLGLATAAWAAWSAATLCIAALESSISSRDSANEPVTIAAMVNNRGWYIHPLTVVIDSPTVGYYHDNIPICWLPYCCGCYHKVAND